MIAPERGNYKHSSVDFVGSAGRGFFACGNALVGKELWSLSGMSEQIEFMAVVPNRSNFIFKQIVLCWCLCMAEQWCR